MHLSTGPAYFTLYELSLMRYGEEQGDLVKVSSEREAWAVFTQVSYLCEIS
jgi:hypothetical protein